MPLFKKNIFLFIKKIFSAKILPFQLLRITVYIKSRYFCKMVIVQSTERHGGHVSASDGHQKVGHLRGGRHNSGGRWSDDDFEGGQHHLLFHGCCEEQRRPAGGYEQTDALVGEAAQSYEQTHSVTGCEQSFLVVVGVFFVGYSVKYL